MPARDVMPDTSIDATRMAVHFKCLCTENIEATMAEVELSVLLNCATEVNRLRAELKSWEKSFSAANNGRKAGREDIKQHPEIGIFYLPLSGKSLTLAVQKYKQFNKYRDSQAQGRRQSAQPSSSPAVPSKKRKRSTVDKEQPLDTQRKPRNASPRVVHPSSLEPYDAPSSHHTPNPPRTFIGPTPQKNGLVLGLFDHLSPRSTPSKPRNLSLPLTTSSKSRQEVGVGTPSKRAKTPYSGSKTLSAKPLLAELLTPSAQRVSHRTPTSSRKGVSRLKFDETPEFLRRTAPLLPNFSAANVGKSQTNGADEESEISWSPVAVRLPPKPAGRGLSALVKGLRGMEEEKMDEELDMLRELEAEELGTSSIKANAGPPMPRKARIQVEDSQHQPEMPLGPDGEGWESSEEEEEQRGRDGKPLKVWKKKGQKRSTRRVVMKPTVGKWKPEKAWALPEDEAEGVMQDTQINGTSADSNKGGSHAGMHEGGGSNADTLDDKGATSKVASTANEEVTKTKAPKKVSATAHANFRALKIKNKQSKGKKGGRFGRRK